LKRVQRAMLWYGMPITLLLICALVLMRDYEVHTFHVTPTLAANALRSVLLAAGHKEVAAPEQASVLWSDAAVHQTLTPSAVRTQRVNTLPGMVPARPDAACRALAEARARDLAETRAAVERVAAAAAHELRHLVRHAGRGRASQRQRLGHEPARRRERRIDGERGGGGGKNRSETTHR
jgi:hypothetical protein